MRILRSRYATHDGPVNTHLPIRIITNSCMKILSEHRSPLLSTAALKWANVHARVMHIHTGCLEIRDAWCANETRQRENPTIFCKQFRVINRKRSVNNCGRWNTECVDKCQCTLDCTTVISSSLSNRVATFQVLVRNERCYINAYV